MMAAKTKEPKFKVWQGSDGLWCCSSPELPKSYATGATADEAIANQKSGLQAFDDFKQHLVRKCEAATCEYCERGTPQYPADSDRCK